MTSRLGGWAILSSPVTVESLGRAGFDFVGLDVQHGTFDFESAARAVQLLDVMGVATYFRLSEGDLALAPRLLDYGATGVIAATVGNVDTARRAVALARYQPEGVRSYGSQRFGLRREPLSPMDVRPEVWVMIETVSGAANVAAIARTPGLSGLYIGPADLALAYGVKPGTGPTSGGWRQAIEDTVREAHAAGVEAGTFARDGAAARALADEGFDRIVISSDIAILRVALARELAAGRGLDPTLAVVDVEI
jgi:4-hydroxy-2-oxoheptanedioate aldolase